MFTNEDNLVDKHIIMKLNEKNYYPSVSFSKFRTFTLCSAIYKVIRKVFSFFSHRGFNCNFFALNFAKIRITVLTSTIRFSNIPKMMGFWRASSLGWKMGSKQQCQTQEILEQRRWTCSNHSNIQQNRSCCIFGGRLKEKIFWALIG